MKSKIITFSVFLLLILTGCSKSSEANAQLDEYLAEIDDMTIEEITEKTSEEVKTFERFLKFFDGEFTNEIESIKKEDERYDKKFTIDTSSVVKALNQFNNAKLTQSFSDYRTTIDVNKAIRLIELPKEIKENIYPEVIYYKDGTTENDPEDLRSYRITHQWKGTKPVDSILFDYNIKYLLDYDVVELSNDNTKANLGNNKINLEKLKDNYVYISVSDSINKILKIEALNEERKVLDDSGSSNGGIAPEEQKEVLSELVSFLKQLESKLKAKDFKNTEELKTYLRKELPDLNYFSDNDGVYHLEKYYHGNVKSVRVYIKKNTLTKQAQFIAKNEELFNSPNQWYSMPTDKGLAFLDENGKVQFTVKSLIYLRKLGNNFYQDDNNTFYHLNKRKKKLDKVRAFGIEAFTNGLSAIQYDENIEEFKLFTLDNKEVKPEKKYQYLVERAKIIFGKREAKFYIIDKNGKEISLKNIKKVYYNAASEDRVPVINSDNKYGFINSKGAIVIPFKYFDVSKFRDGITAVKYNKTYKLINKNGEVIVDTGEDYKGLFEEDENGKRIYVFRNKKYNYKAELIND